MEEKIDILKKAFGHKLVGKESMKRVVCRTMLYFPRDIIKFVTRNCWFVSSFDDAWGFTLRGDEVGRKYLIFLSDELLAETKEQQMYTIAHEVGHVILGHKNAILESQTKRQTAKQEREADAFAKFYLNEVSIQFNQK